MMTISTTDIKLRTPERLTDLPDGGGRQWTARTLDFPRTINRLHRLSKHDL